jgi:hypothetical protein
MIDVVIETEHDVWTLVASLDAVPGQRLPKCLIVGADGRCCGAAQSVGMMRRDHQLRAIGACHGAEGLEVQHGLLRWSGRT